MINEQDNWRLEKIEIRFCKGYSFNNTHDRYEGKIVFVNGEEENFQFKIREDLAQPYIDLMAKDIVKAAESLGERLMISLKLKDN